MDFVSWQPPHNRKCSSMSPPSIFTAEAFTDDRIPYHTLMEFADPTEREINLGPLHADELKSDVHVFGSDKYTEPHVQASLANALRKALQRSDASTSEGVKSDESGTQRSRAAYTKTTFGEAVTKQSVIADDPVAEVFMPKDNPSSEHCTDIDALSNDFSHVGLTAAKSKGDESAADKAYSSREMHERAHQTSLPTSKTEAMVIDHLFIKRALGGYLFDPGANKEPVKEDPWLVDVWDWISCKAAFQLLSA